MDRVLPLVKKDLKHLWPQIVFFWGMMATAVFFPVGGSSAGMTVGFEVRSVWSVLWLIVVLSPIACWSLVIAIVHEDRVIGDRQYWLTRPFTWRDLVAAKLLLIVCAINFPLLLLQAADLTRSGLSLLTDFPDLLWRQLFFTALMIFPPAALGTVTRNLAQVVAVVMGGLALLIVLIYIAAAFAAGYSSAPIFGWMIQCEVAIVAILGCVAVLMVQYARRGAWLGRIICALTLVAIVVVLSAYDNDRAFAIQSWLSGRPVAPGSLQISFDAGGGQPAPPSAVRLTEQSVLIEIPIRISDLPEGAYLHIDRGELRFAGKLLAPEAPWPSIVAGKRLAVRFTTQDYAIYKDRLGDLRGSLDLTLLVPAASPGGWACSYTDCVTSHPRTVLVNRWAQAERVEAFVFPPRDASAPIPTSPWFNPVTHVWVANYPHDFDVLRPVAWLRRTVDFREIRPADYFVPPGPPSLPRPPGEPFYR